MKNKDIETQNYEIEEMFGEEKEKATFQEEKDCKKENK